MFDPERFSASGERERHHLAFLPFGGGPRICMGKSIIHIQEKIHIWRRSEVRNGFDEDNDFFDCPGFPNFHRLFHARHKTVEISNAQHARTDH